jgi:hypothetical protein
LTSPRTGGGTAAFFGAGGGDGAAAGEVGGFKVSVGRGFETTIRALSSCVLRRVRLDEFENSTGKTGADIIKHRGFLLMSEETTGGEPPAERSAWGHHTICSKSYAKPIGVRGLTLLSKFSFRICFKGDRFEEALTQGDTHRLLGAPKPHNYAGFSSEELMHAN